MSGNTMQRTFTGRHMLVIMLVFFGIVIAVNVTMAVFANSSWTGFVVRNSYIASQEFNGKVAAAREQQALGWSAALAFEGGEARLTLADSAGAPIAMDRASIVLRSPATDAQDRTVELAPSGMAMAAPLEVRDGVWVVEIDAWVAGHDQWRDTRRISVVGGVVR